MEPQEAPPVGGMSRPPRPDAAAVGCGVDCFLDVTLWPCVARGGLLVSGADQKFGLNILTTSKPTSAPLLPLWGLSAA